MAAAEVILVRHGDVDYRRLAAHDPVYRGCRYDFAPLSGVGTDQVLEQVPSLADFNPDLIVSSPYTRTLQTAGLLSGGLGCRLEVDLRLHDWLPVRDGAQEVSAEVVAAKIDEYELWKATGRLPLDRSWETHNDMHERLLASYYCHRTQGRLILVTHEAVIKTAVGTDQVPLASWHRWNPTAGAACPGE